jgi:hypothetical protein
MRATLAIAASNTLAVAAISVALCTNVPMIRNLSMVISAPPGGEALDGKDDV